MDPYRQLGLAPTLDLGAIKRAYFAAIARCPPHRDPEAFRAIRAAYEALLKADTRAAAFFACSLDVDAELRATEGLKEAIERAQTKARDEGAHRAEVAAFTARASEASLEDACREFQAGHATAG
jgi:curved DNA-binding protein CbpA